MRCTTQGVCIINQPWSSSYKSQALTIGELNNNQYEVCPVVAVSGSLPHRAIRRGMASCKDQRNSFGKTPCISRTDRVNINSAVFDD